MTKPLGRSDDMMVVKGVNVFPSQIETVLLNEGYPANYELIVDRVNNSDTIEVNVEMSLDMFNDLKVSDAEREKKLVAALKVMLGIKVDVETAAAEVDCTQRRQSCSHHQTREICLKTDSYT